MTIYVAAPYELRLAAAGVAKHLESLGHIITAGWLTDDEEDTEETAMRDLYDIDRASCVVLLNPEEWARIGTGGRHVEFGYALASGKELVIIGARTNLFHKFTTVRVLAHVEDF